MDAALGSARSAFRGMKGENAHHFILKGLQPSGIYAVKFHDHSSPDARYFGRQLMEKGLKVTLRSQNSSDLIFIAAIR